MLNMFEGAIRGEICQASYRNAKENNKYMMNYDKNKESSFLVYDDANNLYGFAMSKKLPEGNFVWIEKDDISIIDEGFIKNYDEDSDQGYPLEVDVEYPINIRMLLRDVSFLPERMKINKCTKLVSATLNKKKYVVHIMTLKQALNHGSKLTKVHRIP